MFCEEKQYNSNNKTLFFYKNIDFYKKINNFNKLLNFFFLKKGYLGVKTENVQLNIYSKNNELNFFEFIFDTIIFKNISSIFSLELLIKRFKFSIKYFYKNFDDKIDYKNIFKFERIKFLEDFFLTNLIKNFLFSDKPFFFNLPYYKFDNNNITSTKEEGFLLGQNKVLILLKIILIKLLFLPKFILTRIFIMLYFLIIKYLLFIVIMLHIIIITLIFLV